MRKWQLAIGGAALGLMALSGCAGQLSPDDRALLNQSLQTCQAAEQNAQIAQTAASTATDAADRAEKAAMRAERAANAAAESARLADESATKSGRAFEMGQRK